LVPSISDFEKKAFGVDSKEENGSKSFGRKSFVRLSFGRQTFWQATSLLFKEREKKDEIWVPRLWVKNHLAEWHFVDPHSIKWTSRSSDRIIAVCAKHCNTV
jgi:hypothetical protein